MGAAVYIQNKTNQIAANGKEASQAMKFVKNYMVERRYGKHFPISHSIKSKVSGVYIIFYGSKYYIGQAIDVRKRLSTHQRLINSAFTSKDICSEGSLKNTLYHLCFNFKIKEAVAVLVEECKVSDLRKTEQKYLSLAAKDKNCLNASMVSNHMERHKKTYYMLESRKLLMLPTWKEQQEIESDRIQQLQSSLPVPRTKP